MKRTNLMAIDYLILKYASEKEFISLQEIKEKFEQEFDMFCENCEDKLSELEQNEFLKFDYSTNDELNPWYYLSEKGRLAVSDYEKPDDLEEQYLSVLYGFKNKTARIEFVGRTIKLARDIETENINASNIKLNN